MLNLNAGLLLTARGFLNEHTAQQVGAPQGRRMPADESSARENIGSSREPPRQWDRDVTDPPGEWGQDSRAAYLCTIQNLILMNPCCWVWKHLSGLP